MNPPSTLPTNSKDILRYMAWRELALRFLDGYNPQPERAIVIADCILSYDGPLPEDEPLRHMAHVFVAKAYFIIERKDKDQATGTIGRWIDNWNKDYGV